MEGKEKTKGEGKSGLGNEEKEGRKKSDGEIII